MAEKEKPLYEYSEIIIDSLPHSPQDHYVAIIGGNVKRIEYLIQRGILKEFANTTSDEIGSKMKSLDEMMVMDAIDRGLTVNTLHNAIVQAYNEEERRYQVWLDEDTL